MQALPLSCLVALLAGCTIQEGDCLTQLNDCQQEWATCMNDLNLKRPEWIACQIELNECKDELAALLREDDTLLERDTYGR